MEQVNDVGSSMTKRIWKLRFALRIQDRSWCNWSMALECAEAALEDLDDSEYLEFSPEDAAEDELSYWND